ncbi:UNVERIFIED_CONTAM: hypothetical protein Sindi_0728900 [Sesamum indicum]
MSIMSAIIVSRWPMRSSIVGFEGGGGDGDANVQFETWASKTKAEYSVLGLAPDWPATSVAPSSSPKPQT